MGGGGKGSGSDTSSSSGLSIAEAGDGAMARGAWGNKVEFILTCIGFAVGLGNVWRFPYLVYNSGGAAFLIPFLIMLFVIGIPLFYMELCWGQFASLGPIAIWHMNPLMKGLGVSMVIVCISVGLYYNVIVSWCLYFLFASMTDKLPWDSCGNPWNTPFCKLTADYKNFTANQTTTEVILNDNSTLTINISELQSPSYEFYYRKVLQLSWDYNDSGTVVWQLALCLFLSWTIVYLVLIKGIGSLGKVVYFTSIFPYVLLTIMLVRGVTLEGAGLGIEFYLIPQWDKLGELEVWTSAATQIFYALSTCTGGLLAMASYNPFNNNTTRDALIVPIVNILTSFYAGFVVFSVLGYIATQKNIPVSAVAAQGPGLVFIVYPEGLSTMPVAPLWSILFFFMMLMLGLSSMFAMAECFFSALMDEYPQIFRKDYMRTVLFRTVGTLCFFLISLCMVSNNGFVVFSIWDKFVGEFPLLFIGLIEMSSIMYIYGAKNFFYDIEMMLGKQMKAVRYGFGACFLVLTPAVILAVIIISAINYSPPVVLDRPAPAWGEALGWIIVTACVVFIPVVFIYQFIRRGGRKFKDLYRLTRPSPEWGPADPANRTGKYAIQKNEHHRAVDPVNSDAKVKSEPVQMYPSLEMKNEGVANKAFQKKEKNGSSSSSSSDDEVADL